MEQVKHAIETGALRPGEQLPSIRPLAEELVVNPNTVAKAYRELEHEGVIELRQGAGAFVSDKAPTKKDADKLRAAQATVAQRDRETASARRHRRGNPPAGRSGTRQVCPPKVRRVNAVSDRRCDRNGRPVEALRRCGGAAGTRSASALGIDLRLPRQERRRQDDNDQGPARDVAAEPRATRASSACRRSTATPASRFAAARAFVSDEKDLYDYMTVGEIVAFTRSFYPRWRADLEQQYLRKFDLSPGRDIKGLSRGMRTKLAMLLALCRGAELLMLDEPTSGLDPAMAEEVLQALVGHVAARRIDGVLLVASARRSRADRRSRRDHRSRPDGGVRRARRSARAVSAHPAGVRGRRAGDQGARARHAPRAPPGPRASRCSPRPAATP